MTNVVIPAHNEQATIRACLEGILDRSEPSEFRIIVVCNGCTDRTGDIVTEFAAANPDHEVILVEIPQPSKVAALNSGVEVAGGGPTIFLDADVLLSTEAARGLAAALADPAVHAASTSIDLETDHCSMLSRSYHRFWSRLPSIRNGLAGRGVYALDEAGLDRIDRRFPDIVADDRFVDLMFGPDERTIVDAHSTVRAARGIRELVRRKVRVFAGNNEIESTVPPRDSDRRRGWPDVIADDPLRLVDLPIYLVVNLLAKAAATYVARLGTLRWGQDDSSRFQPTR